MGELFRWCDRLLLQGVAGKRLGWRWLCGGCAEVERHAYVFGFVSGEACEVSSALQTA